MASQPPFERAWDSAARVEDPSPEPCGGTTAWIRPWLPRIAALPTAARLLEDLTRNRRGSISHARLSRHHAHRHGLARHTCAYPKVHLWRCDHGQWVRLSSGCFTARAPSYEGHQVRMKPMADSAAGVKRA